MNDNVYDIIVCANFDDDRLRGFSVAKDGILAFSIDLHRRRYNTFALPCKCAIYSLLVLMFSASGFVLVIVIIVISTSFVFVDLDTKTVAIVLLCRLKR